MWVNLNFLGKNKNLYFTELHQVFTHTNIMYALHGCAVETDAYGDILIESKVH